MQKNNKKASILLWSIFISMILSIFFIGISTKVTKTLKNNDNIIEENQIFQIVNKQIIKYDFSTIQITKNQYLIFENINPLTRLIKKEENLEILFNSGTTITLKVKKIYGSDLYYETYQGVDINNIDTITSSGIIENNITLNLLNSSNNRGKIKIKNLGGESKIKINSQKSIIPKTINYKIIKLVGNKQIIKTNKSKELW